tara:strand:+ start:410 stop:652 length:243 start_codon:yes stop_codon:yes gene_type:complete
MYERFILTCSPDLIVIKGAKLEAKTLNEQVDSPEENPIIFCSAIPIFKNLSGKVFLNLSSPDEFPKSAEIAKILLFCEAK